MARKRATVVATLPVESFDAHAVELVRWLRRHGYESYIVGGSVRDLLLGRTPKDFDVVTSARPHEIERLVPNSRIIGRRFKLVHVYVKDEAGVRFIETSTFRARPSGSEARVLRRDNAYGSSPEEDAHRRDFTVNAFYYDVDTQEVHDFLGHGMTDLNARLLRVIGVPKVRFLEDPVRIMRAVRFSAKLGFEYEEKTLAAMKRYIPAITEASPRRVKDEFWKMMLSSYGSDALRQFMELGFMQHILPAFDELWGAEDAGPLLKALKVAGSVPEGVVDKVVLAPIFLYPVIREALEQPTYTKALKVMPLRELLAEYLRGLGYTHAESVEAQTVVENVVYVVVMKRRGRRIRDSVTMDPSYSKVTIAYALLTHAFIGGPWDESLLLDRMEEVQRDRDYEATKQYSIMVKKVKRYIREHRTVTPYLLREFGDVARKFTRMPGYDIQGEEEGIVLPPSVREESKGSSFRPLLKIVPRPFKLEYGSREYYKDPILYEHEFKSYKRDVEFYVNMAAQLGGPVLDLGCGTGRLMVPWVREGIDVVGVDLSPAMLERAQQRLNSLGPRRRKHWKLVRGDMTRIRLGAKYNVIVSAFNTMMHLYTREDMKRFLQNVKEHLAPSGTFIFDILNPNFEWLAQDPSKRWGVKRFKHPRHGVWYWYSSNHYYDAEAQIAYIYVYHEPVDASGPYPAEYIRFAQRIYFPQEMMELLEGAGFKIDGLFGHFDSRELTLDAPVQVYVVSHA